MFVGEWIYGGTVFVGEWTFGFTSCVLVNENMGLLIVRW